MRKIIFIYLLVFVFTSCNKDFDTINDNKKAATVVPASTLYSNAQKELVDNMTSPSVNTNIFRLLAQQWSETTYADETQYDISTRNNARNFWNPLYRDVLKDFSEAKRIITADVTFTDQAVKNNQLALTEILSIYAWSVLVNTFGDIPYSEALDYTKIYPKYDDAAGIYADLFTRLDAALASMDADAGSFSSEADIIYGGDVAKWIKFGNSLKLRLAMTLADVSPDVAKTMTAQAVTAGVFTSNDDNALYKYLPSPPNTNPIWVNLIQSQRIDFLASNTIIGIMKPLSDPRLPFYFNPINGDFVGGIYGAVNPNNKASLPSDKITAEDFPGDILDYSEVEFYLAEAAARGFIAGTAQEHYNTAITASIEFWGGSAADAAAYLGNPKVAYTTATGDFKQKIGTQKWIALYNRGFEAWTEYRRFDYPVLNAVADPKGPFPYRFPYSDQEGALNAANYNAAVAKLAGGKDSPSVKLFWDVK